MCAYRGDTRKARNLADEPLGLYLVNQEIHRLCPTKWKPAVAAAQTPASETGASLGDLTVGASH